MYKKVLVAVLMLALLASGVGLGIHLLHKDALAQVHYTVDIFDLTVEDGLEGATVWFSFDDRDNWLPTVELGGGLYEYITLGWEGTWLILLEDPAIVGDNEIVGSATTGFQHWDVETVP